MVRKLGLILVLVLLIFLIKKTNIVLVPEKIFSENKVVSEIKKVIGFGELLSNQKTEIIITGDVMLGRSVMATSLTKKDFNYPFLWVAEVLKNADLTFVNLETPIIKDCPVTNDGMIFCTDPRMISGLNLAGVDVANLANNHTRNHGNDGLIQTQDYLKNNGIDYVGINNLAIKEINKTKFGFLGFDFLSNSPKESDYELIKQSKEKVDVLIVMTHWGVEYRAEANQTQKNMAKKIIESGADLIAGTHPHWVQNVEYINEKPVFYSLGNFVFDQSWSEETKKGLAIKLKYQGNKLIETEKMPIYMKNFSQPNWVNY